MTAALAALNRRTFASLRKHRNYRLFFAGQVVSLAGTWMQNIALAWFVVELTHSPVAVGLLAFCRFIPFTLFGMVSGVVVDRLDIRRLVISTQIASMVVSIALAALAFAGGADMVSGIFRGTIWNQTIPDHLRGRLAGIEQISYSTGPLLGNVEAGLVASLAGLRASVVSGGILCVVGVALAALALPAFRRYDARERTSARAAPAS